MTIRVLFVTTDSRGVTSRKLSQAEVTLYFNPTREAHEFSAKYIGEINNKRIVQLLCEVAAGKHFGVVGPWVASYGYGKSLQKTREPELSPATKAIKMAEGRRLEDAAAVEDFVVTSLSKRIREIWAKVYDKESVLGPQLAQKTIDEHVASLVGAPQPGCARVQAAACDAALAPQPHRFKQPPGGEPAAKASRKAAVRPKTAAAQGREFLDGKSMSERFSTVLAASDREVKKEASPTIDPPVDASTLAQGEDGVPFVHALSACRSCILPYCANVLGMPTQPTALI